MGYGDQLMAAGLAQDVYASDPTLGPVAIRDSTGALRWSDLWEGNPAVWGWQRDSRLLRAPNRSIQCGKGQLPYLVNPYSITSGWRFTDWRVQDHRPRLYLTAAERAIGDRLVDHYGRYVVLEPTALRKHSNRRPPAAFWDALRFQIKAQLGNPAIVQLAYDGASILHGVIPFLHGTFREACGALNGAALLVSTEGGLAHAAAALRIPAVVLWGGNISCHNLGYPEHVNLVDASAETPCGRLVVCEHCAAAWARLDPAAVAARAAEVYTDGLPRPDRPAHR